MWVSLSFDTYSEFRFNHLDRLSIERAYNRIQFQIQENAHPSNSCFVRNYNLNTGQPGITWALDSKYYPTTYITYEIMLTVYSAKIKTKKLLLSSTYIRIYVMISSLGQNYNFLFVHGRLEIV